jgi:hypothetical protein
MAGRRGEGSARDEGLRDDLRRRWRGKNGRSQLRSQGSQRAVQPRSKHVS